MRFILKGPFRDSNPPSTLPQKWAPNIYTLARKIGYHFQGENKEKDEFVFTRPSKGYPRFHLFLKMEKNDNLIFNLHLDQKRPIYKGTTAHSGEYEGETVEKEAERIKLLLKC